MKVCSGSLVWVLPVTILLVGCSASGSKELSRSRAKGMIDVSDQFKTYSTKISISTVDEVACGERAGWWEVDKEPAGFHRSRLTEKGKGMFTDLNAYAGVPPGPGATAHVVLKRRVVEVTGIRLGQDNRHAVADFTWKDDEGDWPARPCFKPFVQTGTGEAAFQLYDDGWRLVGEVDTDVKERTPALYLR